MEFFEIIRRKRQREKEKQHTQEVEFVKAKDEISRTIDDNLKYIKELLVDNDDIVYREFYCMNVKCATVFVDGLVSREIIDRDVIKHLMIETSLMDEDISQINAYEKILNHILATADIKEVTSFKSAILDLLCGETLLLWTVAIRLLEFQLETFQTEAFNSQLLKML